MHDRTESVIYFDYLFLYCISNNKIEKKAVGIKYRADVLVNFDQEN